MTSILKLSLLANDCVIDLTCDPAHDKDLSIFSFIRSEMEADFKLATLQYSDSPLNPVYDLDDATVIVPFNDPNRL